MSKAMLLLAAGLLTACGAGGGERPEIAPTTLVLFAEDFDHPIAGDTWTVGDASALGDAQDSIVAIGPTELTLNERLHLPDAVLEIGIEMAWPGDCPDAWTGPARPIQLTDSATGLVLASLVVERLPGCDAVLVEYRVDPAGVVATSSVLAIETWPLAEFGNRWSEHVLVLYPDGLVRWMRDGEVLITSFTPLADRPFELRLTGREEGGEPVRFDRVEMRRP